MVFSYSPGKKPANRLKMKTVTSAVTPAMNPPNVQACNVCVTVNFPNRDTTQKPESFGNERPIPPAQIASPRRIGDTPSSPIIGPRILEVVTNARFHDIIVQATNNPVMVDTIERMQSIIYLFRKTVVYQKRPFLIDEHDAICSAIESHQPNEAERLMKEHLEADLDFCLHILR